MKNLNNNMKRGFVNLIVMAILAAIVIGGGTYLVMKKSPDQKAAEIENTVSDIGASVPSLDFSASPLPDLNVSSLNVAAAAPKTSNIFSAPRVDTDFSFKSPNLDIKVPSVSAADLNFTMPTIPTGVSQPSAPTGGAPASIPQGEAPSSGSGAPAVDCGQFNSMPDASYCSMVPDPNGQAACKKCKGQ